MSLRRKRTLAWVLVVLAYALAGAGALVSPVGEHLLRTEVLPRLEERIGRSIELSGVAVRLGRVELRDVLVRGGGAPSPFSAPRVVVRFSVWPLVAGQLHLESLVLERPRITVVRSAEGEDNITPILRRLRGKKDGATTEPAEGHRGGHTPDEIRIENGTVSIEDDALGTVDVGGLDLTARQQGAGEATLSNLELRLLAGPSARAKKVRATFHVDGGRLVGLPEVTVDDGEVRIWKGFAVSGVRGGVTPDDKNPGRVMIDLRGGYGGVDKVLWSAKGEAEPGKRSGSLSLVAARFDLGQLGPMLVGTPIVDSPGAQADAGLELTFRPDNADPKHLHDALDFDGRVHFQGVNVFHPMLGPNPVKNLGLDAEARGSLEPRARAVHIKAATVDFRGVKAHLDLDASHLERLRKKAGPTVAPPAPTSDGSPAPAPIGPPNMPAVRAHLLVDAVPCQAALAAIPPELAPNLQGFKLQGTFKSELSIDIDPDALDKMELSSKIGIDACNVLQAPSGVAGDKLRATFDHAVEVEPGSWLAFSVGPENPEWIPYAEISPHLINSIMTTEDSTFLQHKGFIGREFKSALRTNLEHGAFRLGASSITMQLVKNVLLSREKTLSRKLQELFLTWYVEHNLSKTRILEIYFNVIEYGPGIYGIGRAAKHYFGKLPRELSPREASFFSSILPSPKRRYVHYCKGPELDQKWEQYLNRILRRMHERGRLTDEEFDKAIASPLRFDMKESMPSEKCLEMVRRLSVPQAPGGLITIPLGRALEAAPPEATPETDAPGTPAPLPTEVPEP